MKKILSIILAILMVATAVPFAFAAETDGTKTTLDISQGKIIIADTYVTQNGENIALDSDGYIITGESQGKDTVLEFLNESTDSVTYDVVFENLDIIAGEWCTAIRFKGFGPMIVNIEVIGNNYIETDNHAAFSNQGYSTLTVNLTIAENANFEPCRYDSAYETYYSEPTELYINGKEAGVDGHIHDGGDGIQYCGGYKCGSCGAYYGEGSGVHTGGVQTCKGYECVDCGEFYGEKAEHTMVNNICKVCQYVADNYFRIVMMDDYGDGWNNSAIVIYSVKDGVRTKVDEVTFDEGVIEYSAVLREEDTDYVFVWKIGDYNEECHFIIDYEGEIIYLLTGRNDLENECELAVVHCYEYKVTTPAECEANAKETGICTVCGVTTDEKEIKDSALGHVDNDGDYLCDNACGYEFEKPAADTCPDCGRPMHGDSLIEKIICWFVMLINLVKSMFA